MKSIFVAGLFVSTLTGCVVAPPEAGVVVRPGVAYVAPAYPAPGPDYVWENNGPQGWGWRHPVRGWYARPVARGVAVGAATHAALDHPNYGRDYRAVAPAARAVAPRRGNWNGGRNRVGRRR
jgi:hypothetical protein